ncbi:unnamed protein product [Fraxinus pennsylvanica]|uniref:Nuclear transcription factor Y subunit n=1 Tax=Fraxinus pennsylvanica TaxID=56036 RepID=A0AAD2DV22_9LAMI|nr:unnamed protein product [Fraxinus pennsylvanica]
MNPYNPYGGMLTTYTHPSVPLIYDMHHMRMLLPMEMAHEPMYVNAKQYHWILHRRQSRVKAELEKKLIKVQKFSYAMMYVQLTRVRGGLPTSYWTWKYLLTFLPDGSWAKNRNQKMTVTSDVDIECDNAYEHKETARRTIKANESVVNESTPVQQIRASFLSETSTKLNAPIAWKQEQA